MECAIVATNIRGSKEEVDDGVNGYLVELSDPTAIAESMFKLADNEDLLKDYQEKERDNAVTLYNCCKIRRRR